MSSSAISICSNALQALGDKPIASFEEDTERARLVSNLWPEERDKLLREHPWSCIRKQVILAPEGASPDFDWQYSFRLPGDWLSTIQIGRRGERTPHEVMGARILANVTALPIVYCWRNEDPSQWDPALRLLAGRAMQAVLAYPVTQSTSLAQLKLQVFEAELRKAKALSGLDNEPEAWDYSPFYEARF